MGCGKLDKFTIRDRSADDFSRDHGRYFLFVKSQNSVRMG